MRSIILTLIVTCISSISFAQIHEVGVFIGGSNFIGDIGRTNYILPNALAGGLVYKYNLNPRIALRGNYSYIPAKGFDVDSGNPFRQSRGLQFTNNIHELAAGIEFNFFDYNVRELGITYTPYILAQLAAFSYKTPVSATGSVINLENSFSVSIPLGVGFKGRISDHLAYAVESGIRLTFKDDIDFTSENIAGVIPDLNPGNGNDFYNFIGFSIVYTFGRPACYAEPE
ncbi:type IX secretion system protein PorG [Tenacibaculum agarivorans]|uniref:type IX secretion system protein PorG n=1 Tax=Tenacibaculum agarivorans TaxID=1908389 RepID=UPI00094B9C29|nr:DUF6089 family protein [Tenacibaculum agarivorans]